MANGNDDFIRESVKQDVTFFTIYDGQLCQKRANPTSGFDSYITKHSKKHAGKEVFIRKCNGINGYLVGIKKEDRETVDKTSKYYVLVFTFQSASGRLAKLEVAIKSNFVAAFAKRIEVIDLMKPIEFGAFWANAESKEINWFKQDGIKVSAQFTEQNPRDLPQWVKNEVTGDLDTTAYWTYLVSLLRKTASEEKLKEVQMMLSSSQADFEAESVPPDANNEEYTGPSDDDIPF